MKYKSEVVRPTRLTRNSKQKDSRCKDTELLDSSWHVRDLKVDTYS